MVGRPQESHVGSKINLEAVLASPDALDPEAVARTLEPVESALLRVLLSGRTCANRSADRLTADLFVTTPARELWRAIEATPAVGFDRAAFVDGLDPTLAAVARTLFARNDPLPDDDESLAPGGRAEPAQARTQPHHRASRFRTRRARGGGGRGRRNRHQTGCAARCSNCRHSAWISIAGATKQPYSHHAETDNRPPRPSRPKEARNNGCR